MKVYVERELTRPQMMNYNLFVSVNEMRGKTPADIYIQAFLTPYNSIVLAGYHPGLPGNVRRNLPTPAYACPVPQLSPIAELTDVLHLGNGTGYDLLLPIDGAPLIVPNGQSLRDWSAYTRGQELERHRFGAILSDLCDTIPERGQTMGRRPWPWDKVVRYICRKIFLTTAWRRR